MKTLDFRTLSIGATFKSNIFNNRVLPGFLPNFVKPILKRNKALLACDAGVNRDICHDAFWDKTFHKNYNKVLL